MLSRVSIIIPTLNESCCIERTLRHLIVLDPPVYEVIIVDAESTDNTVEIAAQILPSSLSGKIVNCPRAGRSMQMNHGARVATGDILCFLHADTWVPDDAIAVIHQTLSDSAISCAGFISLMRGLHKTQWGISLHNFLKTYYAPLLFRPHQFVRGLRLLFGDQVIFCRRADFWECGGFDESMPIMEDGDLCLKLLAKGRIRQVDRVVQSSDRRVAHWGAWRATAIYCYIGILWGIGVSTTYLKRFYEDVR